MVKESEDIKHNSAQRFLMHRGTFPKVLLHGPCKLEFSDMETDLVFDAPD